MMERRFAFVNYLPSEERLSLRQPRAYLPFHDPLQERDRLGIKVYAEHASLRRELECEPLRFRWIARRVLGPDPRREQKLIAGRGQQRTRCCPASTFQVSGKQSSVGQLDADVAYARDHVGP
jgi:hypothetical protein